MAFSRRQGLLLGAGLLALPAGAIVWRMIRAGAEDSRLLAALTDPESAARIGERIAVAAVPPVAVTDAEERILALGADLPEDDEAVRRLLMAQIADDFAADRAVEVDGWLLAATEADLALLAARLSSS